MLKPEPRRQREGRTLPESYEHTVADVAGRVAECRASTEVSGDASGWAELLSLGTKLFLSCLSQSPWIPLPICPWLVRGLLGF